jgi:hypothetical protein
MSVLSSDPIDDLRDLLVLREAADLEEFLFEDLRFMIAFVE